VRTNFFENFPGVPPDHELKKPLLHNQNLYKFLNQSKWAEGSFMDNNSKSSRQNWSNIVAYFAMAFGISWIIWIALAVYGVNTQTVFGSALFSLSVVGPATAAIALTYMTRDKEQIHDYWQRITDTKRISFRWYLVILFLPAVLFGLSALIDIAMGGKGLNFGAQIAQFSVNPIYMIVIAVAAPTLEEFGWRGYVLDKLQMRWNALTSSLILGILWSLWHVPVFLIPGTYQYSLGIGSFAFWTFTISVIPLTILFTWIFNNTMSSTLSAILLHIAFDITAEIFSISERAYNYFILLMSALSIVIVMKWGAGTMKVHQLPAHKLASM
jgi:membrane protease YdiL (CAAX protease family)